jgi:hypothetical protein
MGLKFDVREDMSSFTVRVCRRALLRCRDVRRQGCGVLQLDEPMIHFSDWTKGIRNGKEFKWSKG